MGQHTERGCGLGRPRFYSRPRAGRASASGCVSEDVFNAKSETVIAMAITSQPQRAGFPLTFAIPRLRLPKESWVKISQIRTLSVERIGKKIGRMAPEEVNELVEGLNEILGA